MVIRALKMAEKGQIVPDEIKQNRHVLGAIALTDIVKGGMRERFSPTCLPRRDRENVSARFQESVDYLQGP
jgi:hypothetical protein